ncbi:MAG: hypothetical protein KBC41_00855 [Candidatus Pacebacteria bacterium]|nr:hypothetical protein [Candidatus Paceibacterota bacterium]MBP9866612.1 hypothetical protein [Candidatus Paceibacterota bacterium]
MALSKDLSKILEESALTFEEVRAFETGLLLLTPEEQDEFMEIIKQDPELIYPLYINFKVKLRAVHGTEEEWSEAIETEIVQLEEYIAKRKKVGSEIR